MDQLSPVDISTLHGQLWELGHKHIPPLQFQVQWGLEAFDIVKCIAFTKQCLSLRPLDKSGFPAITKALKHIVNL